MTTAYIYTGLAIDPDIPVKFAAATNLTPTSIKLLTFDEIAVVFAAAITPDEKSRADDFMATRGLTFDREEAIDPPATYLRTIASGQTVIPANSTVDLVTVTRQPNERLVVLGWLTGTVPAAILSWSADASMADEVGMFLERTGNPNEAKARAKNSNLVSSRTCDWLVLGITP